MACVADAQSAARYAAILAAAGFARIATEEHNDAIAKLIADIQAKLMGVSILAGLGKIDLGDVDLGTLAARWREPPAKPPATASSATASSPPPDRRS